MYQLVQTTTLLCFLFLSENRALKAELAQLKGTPAPADPAHATNNAGQAPRAIGSTDQVASGCSEPNSASVMDTTGSSDPVASEVLEPNSESTVDTVQPSSPSPKRRAKELQSVGQTESLKPDRPVKYVTENMPQKFEEQLSETLSRTLSAKFDSMLTKFADNIGAKIASIKARVTALENASLRPVHEGGAGPIKPYFPPLSGDSFKNSGDHAQFP